MKIALNAILAAVLFMPYSGSYALEDIFAITKYDPQAMTAMSDSEWQDFADNLVNAVSANGFTGFVAVPHAHASKNVKNWRPLLDLNIDKQLYLLDKAHALGLKVILQPGNPLSGRWGKPGRIWPAHKLYTHPSIVAVKLGDEPDIEGREWQQSKAKHNAVLREYPDMPIINIFVGEAIGGPSYPKGYNLPPQPDRLPQYTAWWNETPNMECWIRVYPWRSRDKIVRRNKVVVSDEKGDYGLDNPYVPRKLSKPPEDILRLVSEHCPNKSWSLVMPGFGKGKDLGTEAYWRFPTRKELNDFAALADQYGAKSIALWSLTPNKDTHFALLDSCYRPEMARDGSYPVRAVRDIRQKYIDETKNIASAGAKPILGGMKIWQASFADCTTG